MITNENMITGSIDKDKENELPVVISSWSNHYKSWKKMKKNYLLVKYEELLNNSYVEFRKITNFLEKNYDMNFSEEQINIAIKKCNFDSLSLQEDKQGFIESAINKNNKKKKFFFLGPKNNWEMLLDNKIVNQLQIEFKNEMLELEYL